MENNLTNIFENKIFGETVYTNSMKRLRYIGPKINGSHHYLYSPEDNWMYEYPSDGIVEDYEDCINLHMYSEGLESMAENYVKMNDDFSTLQDAFIAGFKTAIKGDY